MLLKHLRAIEELRHLNPDSSNTKQFHRHHSRVLRVKILRYICRGPINVNTLGQQVQPVSRFEQHFTSEAVQRIPQPQQHVTSLEEFEQRQQIHRQQQVFSI